MTVEEMKYEYKLEVAFKAGLEVKGLEDSDHKLFVAYFSHDEQEKAHKNYEFWMSSDWCETVALLMRPEVGWRLVGQYDDRFFNADGTEKKGE